MGRKNITCQKENGLFVIAIDYPPRSRRELDGLIDTLAETSASIAADSTIHVVLLTGRDDAFHIGESLAFPILAESGEIDGRSLSASISCLDAPIIAAFSGRATGLGLELLLAADIRIAAEGCSLSMPQLHAGTIPFDGGTQRLSRIVGKAKALELILTGQRIDGQEARRIGLVNILVSPAELRTKAMEMAGTMALQAPLALRYAKEAICRGMEMTIDQGLRFEADLYFLLHTTEDRHEGIDAFRAKRKATFKGR
jgi:enoyl-CoA hydratase/carnithine racemase